MATLPGSDLIAKAAQSSSGLSTQLKTAWANTSKAKLGGGLVGLAAIILVSKKLLKK